MLVRVVSSSWLFGTGEGHVLPAEQGDSLVYLLSSLPQGGVRTPSESEG